MLNPLSTWFSPKLLWRSFTCNTIFCLFPVISRKNIGYLNGYKVNYQPQTRSKDYRRIGCPTDTFGAFTTIIALVGSYNSDSQTKKEGFECCGNEVSVFQGIKHLVKI